jgi:hypothetical protein
MFLVEDLEQQMSRYSEDASGSAAFLGPVARRLRRRFDGCLR